MSCWWRRTLSCWKWFVIINTGFILSENLLNHHHHHDIKLIFFIRHGQAYSNIARCEDRPDLRDPLLTELGIHQSTNILPLFNSYINQRGDYVPDIILFSPLRRAIQTLNYSFIKYCERNEICIPLADLQENNNALYLVILDFPLISFKSNFLFSIFRVYQRIGCLMGSF